MFDAKALRPANLLKHWQQLRTLEQALNQAAIIAITDHRGTITYANDAFVKISGYRRDELVGSNHRLVKSGYHDPAFYRQMWRTISSGKVWRDEVCNRTKNGELYWVDTTIVPLLGKNGKPEQYVSIRFDITDKKRLESLVMLDPLTGIGNRRFAEQKIHELIASGQAGDQAALVLIDLDKFKQVNDALGHEAGDLLLKRVAERLQEVKGSNDLLARLAGDEFLIFMPGIGDHSQLKRKLALLKRAFRRPFELQSYRITVWPSMGQPFYPRHGRSVRELLRRADFALYLAKEKSSDEVEWFDWHADIQPNPFVLEQEMVTGLKQRQFFLLYQPQVHLRSKVLLGFEALLRWRHPRWGIISPMVFLEVAEKSGFIIQLGEWMLTQAMREMGKLTAEQGYYLSVNLSMRQFYQQHLPELILHIAQETGFQLSQLTLEVTETMLGHPEQAARQLQDLHQLGVRVSLDDFGTGYSSLSRISHYPLQELKIDRTFVQQIGTEKGDALVKTIINLARHLDLDVVAEGIEKPQQLRFLRRHYCQAGQGFLFAPPLSLDDLKNLIRS